MSFKVGHPSYSIKGRFKKGLIPWNKGKKFPKWKMNQETIEKIRKSKLELYKDKTKHPNYIDGRSFEKEYHTIVARRRQIRKMGNGGSHTEFQWYCLKVGMGFMCKDCLREEPEIKLVKDHIIPLSSCGTDDIENIQPLCRSCNAKKYTKLIDYTPYVPEYDDNNSSV